MTRFLTALMIVGSLATTTGCSPTPTAETFYGEWVLVAGKDDAGDLDTSVAVVKLVLDNMTAGGTVCNSYGGEFTGRANDLTVGPLASTEMYCTEPDGIMDLESRYLNDLSTVTAGALVNGRLVLTGPGISLEFDAVG